MKNLLTVMVLGFAVGACGDNKLLSPKVEPSGMSTSTAPQPAAPPVTSSTAPAMPQSPPPSGVPSEPPKSAP
ncbi:MAG TPA: hypothetical protein VGN65_10245, partial [Casimicrobiaceae bacterium]